MLNRYFDELKHATNMPGSLFSPEKVIEQSKLFASHPAVRELHAYVLDDENTSNHHCLITAEALSGTVFFLSHDGDSRVVFETTADFLSAARDAQRQGLSVEDFHPHLSPVPKDQAALIDFLNVLLRRGDCHDLVVSLVPSLDLEDLPFLQLLVSDADFFLGEAVAIEIEKRPSHALLPIAIACTNHVHPQVSSAGARAVRRIQQLP
jgi:hypothetical protein